MLGFCPESFVKIQLNPAEANKSQGFSPFFASFRLFLYKIKKEAVSILEYGLNRKL